MQDSAHRQRALLLATDMAERITANSFPALINQDSPSAGRQQQPNKCAMDCSSAALAHVDLADWQDMIGIQLPNGAGTVTQNGGGYIVTVSWRSNLSERSATCPGAALQVSEVACLRLEVSL